jgi:carbon monoxide dehydrogenase subunit G
MTFAMTVPTAARTLRDPIAVIRCIPGVQRCEPGADGYDLGALVGVGPVHLHLRGTAVVAAEDHRLTATVSLHDPLAGSIYGSFAVTLAEGAVAVKADVVVGGRLGEFAAPLLRRKAEESVRAFAANLARLTC